jgi:hypothetical protein
MKKLINCDIGIKLLKKQYYLITKEEATRFMGYSSECMTAEDFALHYALDERDFAVHPLKNIAKESQENKKIFVIDYHGNKLIVDQTYVYFQSPKVGAEGMYI